MRLGHRHDVTGAPVPFAEALGRRVDLRDLPSGADIASIDALIPEWSERSTVLHRDLQAALDAGAGAPIDPTAPLATPVLRPAKVFGIGFNYADHAREFGTQMPAKPNVFSIVASSLLGHGHDIGIDPAVSDEIDWEAELAVVIGRTLRNVSVDQALDGVFGYTICNDVTARDLQRTESQWSRAKGFDRSHPVGPVIVTSDEIPDPQVLPISLSVNGSTMQKGTTGDMLFSVAQIIAFISEAITLEPGDLIATGTPPGVGAFRNPPVFLADGDVVVIAIAPIGTLENACRAFRGRSPA